MPTVLGVNFGRACFGGPEALEKQGRKNRGRHLLKIFAEKLAGNFPIPDQIEKFISNPLKLGIIIYTTICTETCTNENLEIGFRFRSRNGKASRFPPDFLSHLLS